MLKHSVILLLISTLLISCSKGRGGGGDGTPNNPGGGNTPQSNEGKTPGTSPNGEKPAALSEQDKSRFLTEFKKLSSSQKAIDYAFDPDQSPNLNDSFTKEVYDLLKKGQCVVEKKNASPMHEEGEHVIDENGYFRLSGARCPVIVNDTIFMKGKSVINTSNPNDFQISLNSVNQGKNYRKNLDSDVIAKTGVLEVMTDISGSTRTSTNPNGMTVSWITDRDQKISYVGGRVYSVLIKISQTESTGRNGQQQTRTKEMYANYHVKGSDIDALLQVFSKAVDGKEETKVYLNGQDITGQVEDVDLSLLATNNENSN